MPRRAPRPSRPTARDTCAWPSRSSGRSSRLSGHRRRRGTTRLRRRTPRSWRGRCPSRRGRAPRRRSPGTRRRSPGTCASCCPGCPAPRHPGTTRRSAPALRRAVGPTATAWSGADRARASTPPQVSDGSPAPVSATPRDERGRYLPRNRRRTTGAARPVPLPHCPPRGRRTAGRSVRNPPADPSPDPRTRHGPAGRCARPTEWRTGVHPRGVGPRVPASGPARTRCTGRVPAPRGARAGATGSCAAPRFRSESWRYGNDRQHDRSVKEVAISRRETKKGAGE